jgi:hypothetical protein
VPSLLAEQRKGWGLIGFPLRSTFSPAHPLVRRDVPLARARGVRDRALREHRRSSASILTFLASVAAESIVMWDFEERGWYL